MPRIAPYPETDDAETDAVNIFEMLLRGTKVKVHVNKRDKVPNHDGHIELVNDKNEPIGNLFIQIKKLPNEFDPKNPKIKIPISSYEYSKTVTSDPFLFIGVDIDKETGYWIYIHDYLRNTRGVCLRELDQKSTTISLKLDNVNDGLINGKNNDFVDRWRKINKDHLSRVDEFNELKKLNKELKKLEKYVEPSLGIIDDDFSFIHVFLDDAINSLNTFKVVKERYYPHVWKLGFMYYEFSDSNVIYTIYPIMYNKNDIQIKKIGNLSKFLNIENKRSSKVIGQNEDSVRSIRQIFNEKGLGFTIQSGNPIKNNPKKYALKILIKPKMENILKNKELIVENEFLAKEFCYAFLTRFYAQLGLLKKDRYSIEEISSAYKNTDQGILLNKELPSFLFLECFKFLENNNVKNLEKIYSAKDYSRFKDSSWIWNTLTPDEVMKNLRVFFDNLPSVYEAVISANFPELRNELNEFSDVSKLIVIVDLKEKYEKYEDRPLIHLYYLIGEEPENLNTKIYLKGDQKIPDIILKDILRENFQEVKKGFNEGFKLDGHHYKFKSITDMNLEFIYEDTPILTYIYDALKSKFMTYFN